MFPVEDVFFKSRRKRVWAPQLHRAYEPASGGELDTLMCHFILRRCTRTLLLLRPAFMLLSLATAVVILAAQVPWVYLHPEPADALSARQLGWVALQVMARGEGVVLATHPSQIVLAREGQLLTLSARDAPSQVVEMTPRPTLLIELDHHLSTISGAQRDVSAPQQATIHMMLEDRPFTPRAEQLAEGLASTLLVDGVALSGASFEGVKTLCVWADGSGVTWLDAPPTNGCGGKASQLGAGAPAQGAFGGWFTQVSEDVRAATQPDVVDVADVVDVPDEPEDEPYEIRGAVVMSPDGVYRFNVLEPSLSLYVGVAPWPCVELFGTASAMRSSSLDLQVQEWSAHLGGAYVFELGKRTTLGVGLGAGLSRHRYESPTQQDALGAWSIQVPVWVRLRLWRGVVLQPRLMSGWTSMRVMHERDGETLWLRSPWHVGGGVGVGWSW